MSKAKSKLLVQLAVEKMVRIHGACRVGFLTLTFADNCTDPAEAQRRWRSLRTHVLTPRYREWLRVLERQASGRLHYHVVVVLGFDAATGYDWSAVRRRDYRSACSALRAEWGFWRESAHRFGFGRCQLEPCKGGIALANYVSKYVTKSADWPRGTARVRSVEMSRNARPGTTAFAWAVGASRLYRQGCADIFGSVGMGYEDVGHVLGRHWAHQAMGVVDELNGARAWLPDPRAVCRAIGLVRGLSTVNLIERFPGRDFVPQLGLDAEPSG